MAPRGRPRKGTTRMDAAVDAMRPYGFESQPVKKKMSELLKAKSDICTAMIKVYDGEYIFIEENAYTVLIEALIADQQNENPHEQNEKVAIGETSMANELVESEQVEEGEIVPTGYVDIPICSPTDLPALPPPPPPPPPPEMATALPPLPPVVTPVIGSPLKGQPRIRTKPCYGYIGSDDVLDDNDDKKFVMLPSIRGYQLSPPRTPPAQPESADEFNNRTTKRRTRWDLRPEDM